MVKKDTLVMTMDGVTTVPICDTEGGHARIRFRGAVGLYQFSLFLDASEFNWEELYQVLNVHQNNNERTGPWDFELQTARPLIPSYWVSLDGQKLGLWYVQRVSLEDIANKRFRGRFAFDVRTEGEHELTFKLFRPMNVTWLSARIESDPEDRFQWGMKPAMPPDALPFARWSDPGFWAEQRRKLETTHASYRNAMNALFAWVRAGNAWNHETIPQLVAAYHLDGQKAALDSALKMVDDAMALPAWGRPAEDVYGHNGDIGGASMLRCMTWAYFMLGPQLGDDRRARLLKKITLQADLFMTQTLLMRDYWGGSIVQDHGWRAVHDFGMVAMSLWGLVPEAERWVAYVVPRLKRGLDAAPLDGVLPGSSYQSLSLYTDSLMWYRDALLARTGTDLLDHPTLKAIPAYMAAVLDEGQRGLLVVEYGDRAPLVGGGLFMEALAAKDRDPVAAHLCRVLLRNPEEDLAKASFPASAGFVWGFMAHEPAPERVPPPARPSRDLRWFQDAGLVHYHDDDTGATLALKCGPWIGYHSQRLATGPCDLMVCLPGEGHFSLFLDGKPYLASPDTGYRLRTCVRSVMLVDGEGQVGDVGYPMSIPSQPHPGDQVDSVEWDAASGTGRVRLDLKRAYPATAGVTHYIREFLFGPEKKIVCRDTVVLTRPRCLSWLFHHRQDVGGQAEGETGASIGAEPPLRIEAVTPGVPLLGAVHPTNVVYSYSSAFHKFQHVRFDTRVETEATTVDFILKW